MREPPDDDVTAAPLRDAATVVLLRDGDEAAEVLLLRRRRGSGFAADHWVFPGGVVDDDDRQLPAAQRPGLDAAWVAERLHSDRQRAVGFVVAALRETFEEAGVLLAVDEDGRPVDPCAPRLRQLRAALSDHRERPPLTELLAAARVRLDAGAPVPFARWLTPRAARTRFDAAFFAAALPPDQRAQHDADEAVEQRWITPGAALRAHRAGELALMHPTAQTLAWLADHRDVDAVRRWARSAAMEPILPHVEREADGWRVLHPGDAGYPPDLLDEVAARSA